MTTQANVPKDYTLMQAAQVIAGEYLATPRTYVDGDLGPVGMDIRGNLRATLVVGGTATPAPSTDDSDGRSTAPSLSLLTFGTRGFYFDGSTWSRIRGASATNVALAQSLGAQLTTLPGQWSVSNAAAANTQATASKAAGGAGVRHVFTGISASLASGSTAVTVPATPVLVVVRDGATGAGTIIWQRYVSVITTAGGCASIDLSGLNIPGSANTAMTVEFNAAGGVGSFESVSMQGYTVA